MAEKPDVFGYYARVYSNGDALGEKDNLIYYYDGGQTGTGPGENLWKISIFCGFYTIYQIISSGINIFNQNLNMRS
ncbi:hypothetical protein NSMM_540036 [Nitrosomonas mobilis]|uniref:Uncharacterized protein n=1 Tax=Nitrosomonas mobilis TaxID=51642 RepID=A0A1G5SGV3_9PROT|nr:hypothetical protein NSMM_540036 [Nitrosomonas mobilis]